MAEDMENKTEEATPRKLEEARRKGDVARSPDVSQALSLAGASAVVLLAGKPLADRLAESLLPFIAAPETMLPVLNGGNGAQLAGRVVMIALPAILAVMVATIVGGAGGSLIQTGLIFSADKLKPDFKRVSPMEGFKRVFGLDGLIQFGKTLLKLVVVGFITWNVMKVQLPGLGALAAMSPVAQLPLMIRLCQAILVAVLAFLAVTATVDWVWQRIRFAQKMRMSREELKEDFKQSEGDPHVKAKLKQIRMERSRRRMMANVAKATVVVTNPTHFAVALRYDKDTPAPVCVAKGVDSLALKIREKAAEHAVPIVEDVPLARALYATVEVDEVIPQEHYQAVAKVIGFIMSRKTRRAPAVRP